MSVLLVVVILVLLIVGHELGHFIAAKISRVKVEEFGVGYPPRAFTFGKWGGTEYTLNWLPFGGFVKLFGEDESQKGKGSFSAASKKAQAFILVAGVVMNALIAWALFTGGFMLGMPTAVSNHVPGAQLFISGVIEGSPAEQVGLITGDEIVALSNRRGVSVDPLTPEGVSDFVAEHGGKDLSLTFVRDGVETEVTLAPAHAVVPEASGAPKLGVALTMIASKRLPFFSALWTAGGHTLNSLVFVTIGLWNLAGDAIAGQADVQNLVGPVGLVGVVDDAAGHGLGHVLGLAAFISVNLTIINLIPIPALDGGRLVFVGIEAATRRRVPDSFFNTLNTLGFLAIIILMVLVTYNDVARLLG